MSARRRLKSFKSDKRGVAAVEFALLLPMLLIILIGMAETTEALNFKRKLGQTASSLADLVSQAESISRAEISDLNVATKWIMDPFPTTGITTVTASVQFDATGKARVAWSVDEKGGTPWATGSTPPVAIPAGLNRPNTTTIVSLVKGTYTPMFAGLVTNIFPRAGTIPMEDIFFLRPRFTEAVVLN
ncbi:pilus assembly protein [Microvirga tunisiensis]|uniref:Pilus assembly protein n=2 Tax=Pannonibacter tanglangensis TaxID=2750084 RepID=A0ABW9ZNQ7_9HYPH|nr:MULTISPECIES: TadE/TadG family type IV pilus assembly protein [unclassified Pannonibacter]NBN64667.1 pilus assembly protein [Pannonibacter sp. XCT-34]NBN79202.1 pilus assembly protein [Pannonibacter sp. XCT-53]